MKVNLTYSLPEERDEYELAMNGARYAIVLEDLDNWLRSLSKYQDIETVTVEEVRAKIVELQKDWGVL